MGNISQKYVFYDHYKFLLRKKVNKKTTRQAYYYESYFNNLHELIIQELLYIFLFCKYYASFDTNIGFVNEIGLQFNSFIDSVSKNLSRKKLLFK